MGKIFYGLFATAISLSVAIPCCAISESAVTTPYRIFNGSPCEGTSTCASIS